MKKTIMTLSLLAFAGCFTIFESDYPAVEMSSAGNADIKVQLSGLRMPAATYWKGTLDWIHQSVEFSTNDDVTMKGYKANLWLRVFNATGTAWFDGVRLEEIR